MKDRLAKLRKTDVKQHSPIQISCFKVSEGSMDELRWQTAIMIETLNDRKFRQRMGIVAREM
jgi:hypothetical protein